MNIYMKLAGLALFMALALGVQVAKRRRHVGWLHLRGRPSRVFLLRLCRRRLRHVNVDPVLL